MLTTPRRIRTSIAPAFGAAFMTLLAACASGTSSDAGGTPGAGPAASNTEAVVPSATATVAPSPSPTQAPTATPSPVPIQTPAPQPPTPTPTATATPVPIGPWERFAGIPVPRAAHSAIPLKDGRVLVFGGNEGAPTSPAVLESLLFDPSNGTWAKAGTLPRGRDGLSLAISLDDGRVLSLGGGVLAPAPFGGAEIFDPSTGSWKEAAAPPVPTGGGVLSKLPNGRVILVTWYIGFQNGVPTNTPVTQIFNPADGTWTLIGDAVGPARMMGTLARDRIVLAGGGHPGTSARAESYDEMSSKWTAIPDLNAARSKASSVILPDGRLLLVGGVGGVAGQRVELTTEIYDWKSNSWQAGSPLQTAACAAVVRAAPSGHIVVAGSEKGSTLCAPDPIAHVQVLDPATQTWTVIDPPIGLRNAATAILDDGTVVITGGQIDPLTLNTTVTFVLRPSAWNGKR